jgi:hypothetical protein
MLNAVSIVLGLKSQKHPQNHFAAQAHLNLVLRQSAGPLNVICRTVAVDRALNWRSFTIDSAIMAKISTVFFQHFRRANGHLK